MTMMKVLVNSYTCCPGMGSEPGMGWNWIISIARYCELFVISEGEYRHQCEHWCEEHPDIGNNIHWYWNPVPQSTRDKCWNQGNWTFYPLYRKWQLKTAEIARRICDQERIDILHQLNMIGFREPGYLHEVSRDLGIPLVWGPIGGLKMFPLAYAEGLKMYAFLWLKNVITKLQIKYDKRVYGVLRQSSVRISSIPDSYNAIMRYHGLDSVLIPETGCIPQMTPVINGSMSPTGDMSVIWVGKFDFRKRLDLAIKSVCLANEMLDRPRIKLKIFGKGNYQQESDARRLAEGCSQIVFMGQKPLSEVQAEMRQSHLLLFTSVSEDTSTVVLEAVSNNLPVLCFDACGMSAVINEKVGVKVPLSTPSQSVVDYAEALVTLCRNPERVSELRTNCPNQAQSLSWEKKALQMMEIYKRVVNPLEEL